MVPLRPSSTGECRTLVEGADLATLRRNVRQAWGTAGDEWLRRLPVVLAAVCGAWGLHLGAPFPLSYHWVSPARTARGQQVVVKVGVPERHLALAAAALDCYGGSGAVRLLSYDAERGALLMERANPGTPLTARVERSDTEATAVLVTVATALRRPPAAGVAWAELTDERVAFEEHLRRFGGDEPIPRRLVQAAEALFDELCGSAPAVALLHGDLHHDNVVAAARGWLAIDPWGVVGDPGYECAPMLYNPAPWHRDPALTRLVPARIEQMSAGLGIPQDRVLAWGFVGAVLSEVWTAQGGGTPTRALDVASSLYERLP